MRFIILFTGGIIFMFGRFSHLISSVKFAQSPVLSLSFVEIRSSALMPYQARVIELWA